MKAFILAFISAVSLSACVTPPPPPTVTPQALPLSTTQQTNLRTLLGLTGSSPFTVVILDADANRSLNAGDIAVMSGGITNGEISRRILNSADINTINTSSHSNTASRMLQLAETKWQQHRPVHYTFTLQRSCFCPPDTRKPIEIRVFNNTIQQATVLPEGTPLPAEYKTRAMTIDELFNVIHKAIDNNAARVDVQYDLQYGYPTTLFIDQDERMADEEVSYNISNFKIASGLKPRQW